MKINASKEFEAGYYHGIRVGSNVWPGYVSPELAQHPDFESGYKAGRWHVNPDVLDELPLAVSP